MKALLDRASAALSPDLRRLIVLMAVCFVDMIGLLMIAPLLTFYALRLGGQPSTVGPLFSSFAVAQLLASPIWGRVSDRYGRRPVLLIGLCASAVAYLIFGYANRSEERRVGKECRSGCDADM